MENSKFCHAVAIMMTKSIGKPSGRIISCLIRFFRYLIRIFTRAIMQIKGGDPIYQMITPLRLTMHLTQIPGMPESILAAAEEPLEDGVAFKDLEW